MEIGDASFIGLECKSGDVSDCNDRTDESVPSQLQGYLVLSETETQCGSKCDLDSTLRSSSSERPRYFWTYFQSQAIDIEDFSFKSIIAMQSTNIDPNQSSIFDIKRPFSQWF